MFDVKIVLFVLYSSILSSKCLVRETECGNGNGSWWFCPGEEYPSRFTKCCWDSTYSRCCPEMEEPTEDRLVMLVGLSVITSCIVISVTVIICCFWSKCPLSNMCGVNYTYDNIIAQSKDDSVLNLPPENIDGCKNYSPLHVKMKPVEDV